MSQPLLTGDLRGMNPRLRMRLERLARRLGKTLTINSGYRDIEEQRRYWNGAPGNGLVRGVSVAPPGGSLHQAGDAADVEIDGVPIYRAVTAEDLKAVGLYALGEADKVHVQLYPPGTSFDDARKQDKLADKVARLEGDVADGPLGIGKPGGPLGDTWVGDKLGDAGKAGGEAIGSVASAAASATANAIVDVFAGWAKTDGLRALLYVVLVGGALVLMTMGASRAAGARREEATT